MCEHKIYMEFLHVKLENQMVKYDHVICHWQGNIRVCEAVKPHAMLDSSVLCKGGLNLCISLVADNQSLLTFGPCKLTAERH